MTKLAMIASKSASLAIKSSWDGVSRSHPMSVSKAVSAAPGVGGMPVASYIPDAAAHIPKVMQVDRMSGEGSIAAQQ